MAATKRGDAARSKPARQSCANVHAAVRRSALAEGRAGPRYAFGSPAAGQREDLLHHQRVRQAGAVKRAVHLHRHDDLSITLDGPQHLQRDVDGEDLVPGPVRDRLAPANLAADVLHHGLRRKAGPERGRIGGLDGAEIVPDGFGQVHFLVHGVLQLAVHSEMKS
jgi:hypothetical protein